VCVVSGTAMATQAGGASRTSLLLLALAFVPRQGFGATLPTDKPRYHVGVCPNDLNPNLWVDAQSTCEKECGGDQDCTAFEKCCLNVCGSKSCVAARFAESKKRPAGSPGGRDAAAGAKAAASCAGFACQQQGAECELWDGKPACRCRDRCEKEPDFTCASDGLIYYNRCYMDAEACVKGVALGVVTCKYHVAPPPRPSEPPSETAAPPTVRHPPLTPPGDAVPPALLSNPYPQEVALGGTVSFRCDVGGRPQPDVTWEKRSDGRDNLIMRPDQMYGNVVVTNIGQLVIYSAEEHDAGIYTCTASNAAGLLRANFPLSVVTHDRPRQPPPDGAIAEFPASECHEPPDVTHCGSARTKWYYDSGLNACDTFVYGGCDSNRNRFDTYEGCKRWCQNQTVNICHLPPVQGPCRDWERHWAYNPLIKQCQLLVYGGCEGNENNFESREACEDNCPFPTKAALCKSCKPRQKIVPSFCKSDFAIVGRMTELVEEPDSGYARFTVDEVLKDDKMGLKLFNTKHMEVTLANVDWSCPCPNMTASDGALLVMGEVQDGMAVLHPHSFVRTASERRVRKVFETIEKKTCDLMRRF
uniref:WAP, follistatin/kazal, immunoglobulin, kunitz and netrin domain containing 1 n=1 Tax=Petromyzon marinus TaxID=7757 RepID=S4RNA0_PETMA